VFHKTSITSKLEDLKFIEVTHTCMDRFKTLHIEDNTNITPTKRSVRLYNEQLDLDPPIEKIILELARLAGRKIDLLDSGCGQCVAIDKLLSNPKLKDALASCTGISMNYFSSVEKVMKKHDHRFHYYYGKVQDVLEQTHKKFDLIIDMCGAHLYSVDKIYLLKLYHQALRPGGRAHVFHHKVEIKIEDQPLPFYSAIAANHPKTFFDKPDQAVTISKSFRHFPLPEFKVKDFVEASSINTDLSLKRARAGNAVGPHQVTYVLPESSAKRRRLR
jgi:SAM-dependent methyltransferase